MKYRNMFLKYMAPAGSDGSQDGGSKGGEGEGSGSGEGEGSGESEGSGEGSGEGAGDDEKAELLKEVMKKKGKITELNSELNEANTQLEKFKGVDLEKYNQLLADEAENKRKAEEAEQERLRSEGKIDELLSKKEQEHQGILEQMRTQHGDELKSVQGELTAEQERNAALTAQIEELTVGNAFANSPFIHDKMVAAMTPERTRKLYGEHFDIEAGSVVAYDKPRGAEGRTKLVDKDGKPVGFEGALSRIIEADPTGATMLRSESKRGSGSGSSNGQPKKNTEIGSGQDRILHALNAQKK